MKRWVKKVVLPRVEERLISRKWLYFAMPKCGSKSIHQYAREYNFWIHNHNRFDSGYVELFDRTDLKDRMVFTFVRDPVDRFESAFRYLQQGGGGEGDASIAKKFIGKRSIDEFVEEWLDSESQWCLLREQIHFRPMVNWINGPDGSCAVDLILPMSHIEMVLHQLIPKSINKPSRGSKMTRINVSDRPKEISLSAAGQQKVREVYAADCRLYEVACGK